MNRGQKFVSISFVVLLFICFGVISCFAVTIGTPFPTITSALEFDSSQTAFFYPSSLHVGYDASQNLSVCTAFHLFGSSLREEVSFLDFFSGQSGNGSVQTASDIVKKLIKEGKVNPKDLEVVANQIENALKRFGPAGSKPNSNSFNSLIRKIMEEAKARLSK